MIDKLRVFEVAWAEFVEWMGKKYNIYYGNQNGFRSWEMGRGISYIELRSYLIEFLDSKGIYIGIIGAENGYLCTIAVPEPHNDLGYSCNSRPEAEDAGIIKGIEIYNNQLNQRGEK